MLGNRSYPFRKDLSESGPIRKRDLPHFEAARGPLQRLHIDQ